MSYIYALTDTWNSAPTTFVGIGLNVTDTASAAGSLLMDLQVGGSSLFSVRKDGLTTTRNVFPVTDNTYTLGSSSFYWGGVFSSNVTLKDAGALGWQSADLFLRRDAANTLAQRNGVNAQLFRIYNTYTDASNYERLTFTWSGGGDARIQTEKGGTGTVRSLIFGTDGSARWLVASTTGHFLAGTDNTYDIGASGANRPRDLYLGNSAYVANRLVMAAGGTVDWGDIFLYRDGAANTLAQRNGTAAQTFRVYNTYTDASNYERAVAAWSGNIFYFGTQAAGTGTGSREIIFFTNGTNRWSIGGSTGHFLAAADNTYDIGASGANRPRAIYLASTGDAITSAGDIRLASSSLVYWASRGGIRSGGDGVLLFADNAGTSFNRLQFGGTTSAFPALKRSGAEMHVRLADDSAFAKLISAEISSTASLKAHVNTAIPAGGTAGAGVVVSSTSNFGVFFGSGAPTLSAAKGSLYLRSDGTTTNDRMYVNTDGATTWTAVTTAA